MLAKCTASQWVITVAPKSLAHQYDVDIVFGRPEAIDDENAKGVKKLTKSNDDFHKRLCRHILESLEAMDEITHSYDERAIMWTNKPLKQDINLTVAQPHLDEFLQESLKDSEAVLRILISKTRTINLSDLLFTSVRTNPAEDRTCRTVTEMILSESPVTRKDNPYVSIGAGQLFETSSEYFDRGLIYRDGNKKGVQVVKGSSNNPQLWLSLDFCRKVFFPENVKFIDLVQSFMAGGKDYKEAEALFRKIKLCPVYNRSRILTFKKFSDKTFRQLKQSDGTPLEDYYRKTLHCPLQCLDERAANMSNGHGDFPLELLEVLSNQPVPIVRMPETLKEKALELNRLKPHERLTLIQKQFKKLALNNSVTTAFGIKINSQMIVGDFQRFQRMRIILDRATVESNDQGSFKFDRNMYYNAAGFAKLVVFATRRDYQKSMECANAIVQAALNKGMQMPKPSFKEFDTSSKRLNEWIKAMYEFKGIKTVALIIDNNKESHPIVKLAEALTGVQTQHLFFDTAFKVARGRPQTLENIVHKLNVKAGGINHLVDFGQKMQKLKLAETLIIALDVSHPTGDDYKGSTDEPSIGGLTGNYLADPNEFAGLFFFQPPRQEAVDQTSLQIYVKKMLQQAQKCGRSIKNVILIRDAVSEGQYEMVLEDELAVIQRTTKELSIKAKILGIIVTKDGNTRHFNIVNGQTSSMPPRSFVTFGSRFGFTQFFMTAHRSFAGTAKSVMITVIRDDLGVSTAELQTFLLGLTHMHQIVTAPVSIPAPLYQADVLAGRGQKVFRALKKYAEREIPKREDGTIDYMKLSNLLNFNGGNLPTTRYTA